MVGSQDPRSGGGIPGSQEWWDPKQYKLSGGVVGFQTIQVKWRSGGVVGSQDPRSGGIPGSQEWWDPKILGVVGSQTIQVKFIIKLK